MSASGPSGPLVLFSEASWYPGKTTTCADPGVFVRGEGGGGVGGPDQSDKKSSDNVFF